ncbi:hypothetical protein MXB_3593, partial [Myxobolus squamalis]
MLCYENTTETFYIFNLWTTIRVTIFSEVPYTAGITAPNISSSLSSRITSWLRYLISKSADGFSIYYISPSVSSCIQLKFDIYFITYLEVYYLLKSSILSFAVFGTVTAILTNVYLD